MASPSVSWTLERKGHAHSKYHLNGLLATREKITIGRRAGGAVDIICNGKTVSRTHCVLTLQEGIWHVTDLQSMNGVFLNGTLIRSGEPTALQEGDEVGIGCVDISQEDYHVFSLCKTVIKNEEVKDEAVKEVKIKEEKCRDEEVVSDAVSPQPPQALSSTPATSSNSLDIAELSPPTLAREHDSGPVLPECSPEQSTNRETALQLQRAGEQLSIPSSPSLQECIMKSPETVEETSSSVGHTTKSGSGEPSANKNDCVHPGPSHQQKKIPGTSAIKGPTKDAQNETGQKSKAFSKKMQHTDKKLKMKCVVVIKRLGKKEIAQYTRKESRKRSNKPRVRRLILSDEEDEESDQQKEEQKSKLQDAPVPSTSLTINKEQLPAPKSQFIVEKLCAPAQKPTYTIYDVSDSEDDLFIPGNTTSLNTVEDDDECIILDSDEEIFSATPRIKMEQRDTSEAEIDANQELSDVNGDGSNGPGRDSPERFFPELSQPFLDEIAAEDEAAKAAEAHATTSTTSEKTKQTNERNLDSIVAQHKSKAKEKKTLLTEPKALDVNRRHTNKRFTLATGSDKSNPPSSFAAKLRKDQDLSSYNRCVREADAKKSRKHILPASEQAAEKRDDKKKPSDESKKKNISVSKEKSQGAVPVKAKVTKRSRGDMLTSEMVQESAVKRPNEDSGSALAGYTIPKKQKVAETEAKPSDGKEDGVVEEIPVNVDISALGPVTPSTFKAPAKRVARLPSDDQRENRLPKQARPDPTKPSSPVKKKRRSYQPCSDAIPLGGNQRRQSVPPISVADWRKSRGVEPKDDSKLTEAVSVNDNSMDATLPLTTDNVDEETYNSDVVPEVISESLNVVKRGILVPPGREKANQPNARTGPKVKFDDTEKIKYIETKEEVAALMAEQAKEDRLARSTNENCNELARYNVNLPVQPVQRHGDAAQHPRAFHRERLQPIIGEMLARICNWNYSWIDEQEGNDEPPPILASVRGRESELQSLPALQLSPVPTAFTSIDTYRTVFFPLMLHEIWGMIRKEATEQNSWRAKALVRNITCDGLSAHVSFEVLVQENSQRLYEHDLLALTYEPKQHGQVEHGREPPRVFGMVETVTLRRYDGSKDIDPRLLQACRSPYYRINFNLRMKPGNAPKATGHLISMFRVSSLRTHIKQFAIVTELETLPLYPVIMDPIKNSEAFTMMESDQIIRSNAVLNDMQRKAVASITETMLNSDRNEPKVAMLQGPPGTGKSHVIVQLVLNLLNRHYAERGRMPRILICAPSNNAIDEIVLRLVGTEDFRNKRMMVVRTGVPSSINPNLNGITVETLAKTEHEKLVARRHSDFTPTIDLCVQEIQNLEQSKRNLHAQFISAEKDQDAARLISRKLNDLEESIETFRATLQKSKDEHAKRFNCDFWMAKRAVIAQANVICTTLNSCRNRDMENVFLGLNKRDNFQKQEILCCIIDEASQCTEPESLTPLGLGINKLVLIGDPDQLPATVCSQHAQKLRYHQSLFNRFFAARTGGSTIGSSNNSSVMMLNMQYRMAASICEWPSKYFYAKKLRTDPELVRNGPGALEGRLCDYKVLNVYDGYETTDPSDGKSKSPKNENEAKVVAGLVEALRRIEPHIHRHVGVITFYQSQKVLIQETLRQNDRLRGEVKVNTVDGFQGQEKDIIIVSCVRANKKDVGFLDSLKRMNVALTRARHTLIVCGHFDTLNTDEAWRDLITDATHRGYCHLVTSDFTVNNFELIIKKDRK